MESKNAGLYANLFCYNEQTGELEFVSAGQIDADGNVELEFTYASDYTIVVDASGEYPKVCVNLQTDVR